MKYVYLIMVDDHYDGEDYYLCATEAAADKLFKKIVKDEKYFDPKEDTEKDFEKACNDWFWESKHSDVITCSKYHALTEEEI